MTPTWPGLPITVQSSHIDMFGHVNHTRYLEFMEWARFAFCEYHGFPLQNLVRDDHRGPAIVRAKLLFRRECVMGDKLLVTAEAAGASRGIGRVHQTILHEDTHELACSAEMTFVMIDLDQRRVVGLPPQFLALCHAKAHPG
jgi:acyl-CoA thioester hydrolase/thioesterase-3